MEKENAHPSKIKTAFKVLAAILLSLIIYYPVALFLVGPLVKDIIGQSQILDLVVVLGIFAISLYISLSLLSKKFIPQDRYILSKWIGITVFSLGLILVILLQKFTVKEISLQLIIYPLLAYFETRLFLVIKFRENEGSFIFPKKFFGSQ